MGWETRGKYRYYYQKQRVGGRVVSKYLGKGNEPQVLETGQQAAKQVVRLRREVLTEQMVLDALVEDVDQLVQMITQGAYLAAGYYSHHRQWRKARNRAFRARNRAFEARNRAFGARNRAFEARNRAFEARNRAFGARNRAFEARNRAFGACERTLKKRQRGQGKA